MLLLSTFAVSLLSGLVPVVSIEVYLGGVALVADLADDPGGRLAVAFAAGAGQALAKVAWYYAADRSMRTKWVQRKLSSPKVRTELDRWQERITGRPVLTGFVLLAAAVAGFPPLMIIAVVAGSLRVPLVIYVPTILIGRTARFWLLLAGVGWFADTAV